MTVVQPLLRVAGLVTLALWLGWTGAAGAVDGAATETVAEQLEEAADLLAQGRAMAALLVYERIDRSTDGGSAEALVGAATTALGIEDFERAERYARRLCDIGPTASLRSVGQTLLGLSLLRSELWEWVGSWADDAAWVPPSLAGTIAAFEEAVKLAGDAASPSQLELAGALALAHRIHEAKAALAAYRRAGGDLLAAQPLERWLGCVGGAALVPSTASAGDDGNESTPPQRLSVALPSAAAEEVARGIVDPDAGPSHHHAWIEAVVDADGRVPCARVIRGEGEWLDEVDSGTTAAWRFLPARIDGEPVAAWYAFSVRYRPSPVPDE